MKLISRKLMNFLSEELAAWQAQSLISAEQAARIRAQYTVEKRSFAAALFWFGAFLAGLGVICAVAANWDAIPRGSRMALIVGGYSAALAASWGVQKRSGPLSRGLLLLAGFIFGAGIFLTAQMYHQGGHWWAAMGLWAAGLLPAAWLFCDSWQLLLAQTLGLFYCGGLEALFWLHSRPLSLWDWYILPGFLTAALWCVWSRTGRKEASLHFNILLTLIYLGSRAAVWLKGAQVLMAFFALGVLLMFVRLPERGASLKLWGTALCGLAGIALSVPEIWDSTLVNFEPSDMNDPYHLLQKACAGASAFFTATALTVSLIRGSAAAGMFLVLLVLRYFVDHFFGYLSKAAAFTALGILCLAAGFLWDRHRRAAAGRRKEGRNHD